MSILFDLDLNNKYNQNDYFLVLNLFTFFFIINKNKMNPNKKLVTCPEMLTLRPIGLLKFQSGYLMSSRV